LGKAEDVFIKKLEVFLTLMFCCTCIPLYEYCMQPGQFVIAGFELYLKRMSLPASCSGNSEVSPLSMKEKSG
jgi:hypothetical protein